MSANEAITEGLGGMADLLHSMLVHNDDWPHSGFSSLSDNAYRLGKEIRKSDEWFHLAKAVEAVQKSEGNSGPASVTAVEPAKGTEASKRTGRPRKDNERASVMALKVEGKTWKEIAATMNVQTGQNKSQEAYRALLRANLSKKIKNVQK